MKKRFLAMLSAMAMLITSMSAVAYADNEPYPWYTNGTAAAPVKASRYFIPDSAGVHQDTVNADGLVTEVEGGYTTNELNNGDYAHNIIITGTPGTSRLVANKDAVLFDKTKQYIELEFDGDYVFSEIMYGAATTRYGYSQGLWAFSFSYWDDAAGAWAAGEDTGRARMNVVADTNNNQWERKVTLKNTYTTSKLRFELLEAPREKSLNWIGLTEIIPYGYKAIPKKEAYAWGTATDTVSAPIEGTYSIGSAVAAKSGVLNSEALYDGDYTTAQVIDYTKNTNEARTENHYYEVDFGKAYLIDTVNIGFDKSLAATTIPARSFIDYKDADTGEWVQVQTVYDTYYPTDMSDAVYRKKLMSLDVGPVRATAVRYYPGRLAGNQTGGYHLSEFVVCGKTTYQGKSKETYAWETATTANAAPIKADYSFGSAMKYFDGAWTNESLSYLDDGSYEYKNTCLIATDENVQNNDHTKTIENYYIQMDLKDTYCLDSLLLGTTVLDNYHQKNQLAWYTVEYFDIQKQEWVMTEKYVDTYWNFKDLSDEVYLKGAFADTESIKGIVTNAIRIYPTKTASANYLRLDELVVYGKLPSDYSTVQFDFKNADGETVSGFAADAETVLPKVTVMNPTEGRYDGAKCFVVFCSGLELKGVEMAAMQENAAVSFGEDIKIPENTTEIKVFLWDLDTLEPLADVIEVKKADN